MTVSAGPSAATMTASASTAAAIPMSEDRHPRAMPDASTMVSASTISTALARNADRTRKTPAVIVGTVADVASDSPVTRRDQQQLLVAELGRAALTGATVPELIASAVDTVAEGLNAVRVGLFERRADNLVAIAAQGWSMGEKLALVADDGLLQRVAVRAADPAKQALLDALHREYPPVSGSGQPAAQALAHAGAVQFLEFTPDSLRETTLDDRHFELMTQLDPRSAMAVPLVAHGRVLGALTFAWSESGRRYDNSDTVLAEELGHRAALAIENARLYRSELEAQRRIAFLVEASDVLASSLDYEETVTALARLAVPRLADWCVIYIVGPCGVIDRRAVEHAGGRQDFIRSVLEAHPIRPDAPVGVPAVIRTGRSELETVASPISTASDVEDPEELASALGEIAVRSTMCVPLIARRRTLGAILFVSAESQRVFTESDLRLAEDLAARAAVAVDNARLFNEAEELGTPIAAVYGAAVRLVERDFTGREELRRDLVTQIAEQAARLSAIVDDILFVGKLEAGGLRLEPATVDVVDVARAAVEAARIRAGETTEVTLRAVAESSTIETDAGRLRQVLDNLLDNAIKYSPNGRYIELRVDEDDRWTRLAVSDHGVGIPVGELTRIFDKFYRVHPHQTRGVNGTGLGLY